MSDAPYLPVNIEEQGSAGWCVCACAWRGRGAAEEFSGLAPSRMRFDVCCRCRSPSSHHRPSVLVSYVRDDHFNLFSWR